MCVCYGVLAPMWNICIYMHREREMYIHIYILSYIHVHICIYVFVSVHIYAYVSIYIHKYIYALKVCVCVSVCAQCACIRGV